MRWEKSQDKWDGVCGGEQSGPEGTRVITHISERCDLGVDGLLCVSRTPASSEHLTYQSWYGPRDDESLCLS